MAEVAPLTLSVGDRVVYPNQGVCRVFGIETKEVAGQKLTFVSMKREEDGAAIMVRYRKPLPPVMGMIRARQAEQEADSVGRNPDEAEVRPDFKIGSFAEVPEIVAQCLARAERQRQVVECSVLLAPVAG